MRGDKEVGQVTEELANGKAMEIQQGKKLVEPTDPLTRPYVTYNVTRAKKNSWG